MKKSEEFISEYIKPDKNSFNVSFMSSGMPGVPMKFSWRDKEYRVVKIIDFWKSMSNCKGSFMTAENSEKYVRKHYFKLKLDSGDIVTLYCPRGVNKSSKWVIYTIERNQTET